MNKTFEVGKTYEAAERLRYDPITVIKRTARMITVTNGQTTWKMRIRAFANGIEYAVDSAEPRRYRDGCTYSAAWET